MNKTTTGFTIVELLIVIVVIAILAAISTVAYNGIQDRARNVAVQHDLRQFAQKMEIYRIDGPTGRYPTTEAEFTSNLGISFSRDAYKPPVNGHGGAALYCRTTNGEGYIFIGLSKSGTAFSVGHDHSPRVYTGAGVSSAYMGSQVTTCPAAITGGSTGDNAWAYTNGAWREWVN